MICTFCPEVVDTDDDANYVEVTSWVNGPKLDGPKLRTQSGRVAHQRCIDNLVRGQSVDQPDLFEDVKPVRVTVRTCEKETASGMCGKPIVGDRCEYWRDHLDDSGTLSV